MNTRLLGGDYYGAQLRWPIDQWWPAWQGSQPSGEILLPPFPPYQRGVRASRERKYLFVEQFCCPIVWLSAALVRTIRFFPKKLIFVKNIISWGQSLHVLTSRAYFEMFSIPNQRPRKRVCVCEHAPIQMLRVQQTLTNLCVYEPTPNHCSLKCLRPGTLPGQACTTALSAPSVRGCIAGLGGRYNQIFAISPIIYSPCPYGRCGYTDVLYYYNVN